MATMRTTLYVAEMVCLAAMAAGMAVAGAAAAKGFLMQALLFIVVGLLAAALGAAAKWFRIVKYVEQS